MKVALRVDASIDIGTGHVMRCLTLAEALREQGSDCHFLCREHPGNLLDLIHQRGFSVSRLPAYKYKEQSKDQSDATLSTTHAAWLGCDWETDAEQTSEFLAGVRPDWLIIDHYALDYQWETVMRDHVHRLMVIDDLADRSHVCDLLLDQNIGKDLRATYRRLVNNCCTLLVGPQFAILRPEFGKAMRRFPRPNGCSQVNKIVVMFGGNDNANNTLDALYVIDSVSNSRLSVVVVIGPLNVNKARIVDFCSSRPSFDALVSPSNMAELFGSADLCIGSGGGATYERLLMRLPSLLKPVAENQIAPISYMKELGLIDVYESAEELREKLTYALQFGVDLPPDSVQEGVCAIVSELSDGEVILTEPSPLDVRRTFAWLQDEGLRNAFMVREKPVREKHFNYWRRVLQRDTCGVFSIKYRGHHIGNCGIKNINLESHEGEVWLYLGAQKLRGCGIGRKVLCELLKHCRNSIRLKKVFLNVRESNSAAYGLYTSMSFRVVGSASENFDSRFQEVKRMELSL